MNSSDGLTKIAPAIAAAQAEFKAVAKSGFNTYDKYPYANLEDYISSVRPVLTTHGLSILTSVDDVVPLEDRHTASNKIEHAVRVKLTVRLIHESGEWIEATTWGEGQDRADKAVYKAITGARKYGLASTLGLATSDDPERDEEEGKQPQQQRQQQTPPPKQQQQPAAPGDKPKLSPADDTANTKFLLWVDDCIDAAVEGVSKAQVKRGIFNMLKRLKIDSTPWRLSQKDRDETMAAIKAGEGYYRSPTAPVKAA